MKKIAIVGTPNAQSNYQTVKVIVTEQTAIGEAFGKNGESFFKASNGIELFSYEAPAASAILDRFYVRGTSTVKNLQVAEVPAAMYPRLLAAADEYNKAFKEKVYRHLSVKIAPNPDSNYQSVLLTLTAQSHKCDKFTDEGKEFKASNGVRIQSNFYPSYGNGLLTVRGTMAANDNLAVTIPVADLPRVEAALMEYNKKYAAPAQVAKELKIEGDAVPTSNYQTVKVSIIRQSNILGQFGTPADKSKGDVGEFIDGKIRLASCKDDAVGFKAGVPTNSCDKNGLLGTFYVANTGSLLVGDRRLTCEVPVAVYPEIQKAVLAYNKKFAAPIFVERLCCTSIAGVAVGVVCELIEKHSSGSWKVKLANGITDLWDADRGKVVPAPALDAKVVKDGIIYIG